MSNAPTRKAIKKKPAPKGSLLKEVRKRDGTVVPFDRERIKSAIVRAMLVCEEGGEESAEQVTTAVVLALEKSMKGRKVYLPTVEDVQDTVETELIFMDFAKTAKGYILYRILSK